jgi:Flp pilus assembly pilin Flp
VQKLINTLLSDRRGATAIEYGLIAGVTATGTQLGTLFTNVATVVTNAMPAG